MAFVSLRNEDIRALFISIRRKILNLVLVDSILSWKSDSQLSELKLAKCEMGSGSDLLKALSFCYELEVLYLHGNPLAGSFKDLPPNICFPKLKLLNTYIH